MITFTKEQLIASAHARIEFAEMMLAGELEPLKERTWSIELELARIALASLEADKEYKHHSLIAEQLAHVLSSMDATDHQRAVISCAVDRLNNVSQLLQSSPSALLVPETLDYQGAKELYNYLMNEEETNATVNGWNACRDAMLQGADNEIQRKSEIHDALCAKYNVESLADFVDWQRNHIAELEAAPPAPVGHGEAAVMPDYPGYVMTQRECFEAGKKAGMAELVTTANTLPDGWVACSERMPEDGQEVLTRNKMGHCFVSLFDEHSGLFFDRIDVAAACCIEHILVTHWMPLPAAPQ